MSLVLHNRADNKIKIKENTWKNMILAGQKRLEKDWYKL